MSRVFIYVVDRDFGFAPNPFHGICTLATCKPKVRSVAKIGDWVIGMGGKRLRATGRCVFAMQITDKVTFTEYWNNPLYKDKKPVRNGSKRMVVGDNIYHYDPGTSSWFQADSHHSNPDGSTNESNLKNDTQTDNVLLSNNFYYFGSSAPEVPQNILEALEYKNGIGHKNYSIEECGILLDWLEKEFSNSINKVIAKPFDFDISTARYSAGTNKITT